MRITVLASGSAGNAALFDAAGTRLLIDAGLGPQALEQRLRQSGTNHAPTAILVTHAHLDHFGHATRLARRLRVPLYVSESTARVTRLESVPEVRIFSPRDPFRVGGLVVAPTPVPHDVAQVALVVEANGIRAAIAT
jgi:glyoxylase-like metal-dependent hydrolase (beta-lactamase superfamily II)